MQSCFQSLEEPERKRQSMLNWNEPSQKKHSKAGAMVAGMQGSTRGELVLRDEPHLFKARRP